MHDIAENTNKLKKHLSIIKERGVLNNRGGNRGKGSEF